MTFTVTFDAVQGNTYRLDRKNALSDPDWQQIGGVGDFFASNTGLAQIHLTERTQPHARLLPSRLPAGTRLTRLPPLLKGQ